MKLKILDLFCGVGGVARGFQKFLNEQGIEYEYHAVDIDRSILLAHKVVNKNSVTILRDAYSFEDDELSQYDFIWASPPCETHSIAGIWRRKFGVEPDMRLYELIIKLHRLGIPFVVENVKPYYNPPIKPTSKANRHVLWSNLSIKPVEVDLPYFTHIKDKIKDLIWYHQLEKHEKAIRRILGKKTRDALRDMVHWKIAYEIARQVIPQVIEKRLLKQATLDF